MYNHDTVLHRMLLVDCYILACTSCVDCNTADETCLHTWAASSCERKWGLTPRSQAACLPRAVATSKAVTAFSKRCRLRVCAFTCNQITWCRVLAPEGNVQCSDAQSDQLCLHSSVCMTPTMWCRHEDLQSKYPDCNGSTPCTHVRTNLVGIQPIAQPCWHTTHCMHIHVPIFV